MADNVQQWRRMIQPARARTPAAPEHEDAEVIATPVTPKRGLKPKFSSYFTNHNSATNALRTEPSVPVFSNDLFDPEIPKWPVDEPFPDSNSEDLMDTIMCRLMGSPYDALEPRFNGMLLQIFESYRTLKDENHALQAQISEELSRCTALEKRLHIASKQWSEERQDFKAEVKRLELLLVKGQRGVDEVTLARQESVLRQKVANRRSLMEDDGLQTIFEFLEKNRQYDEKAWSNQRAVMRVRSPSAQMRRLSQQLMSKKSFTNIHDDLPFGTPPDAMPSTLAEASMLETQAAQRKTVSEPRTSTSGDTFSTFSCAEGGLSNAVATPDCIDDSEMRAIHQLAEVLARRRKVEPFRVMPKLLEMFTAHDAPSAERKLIPLGSTHRMPTPHSAQAGDGKPAPASASGSVLKVNKHGSLRSKASGLLDRLRPHPSSNRFSFEAGDEAGGDLTAESPRRTGSEPLALRRSISSSALPAPSEGTVVASFPPRMQSLPTSSPMLDHRMSRIPAPVDAAISVARPRQNRDVSNSSLLTLVRGSDNAPTGRSESNSARSMQSDRRRATRQCMGSRAHNDHSKHLSSGKALFSDLGLCNITNENTPPMAGTEYPDAANDFF